MSTRIAILILFACVPFLGCQSMPTLCVPTVNRLDRYTVATTLHHDRVIQAVHFAFYKMEWRSCNDGTPIGNERLDLNGFTKDDNVVRIIIERDGNIRTVRFECKEEPQQASTGASFFEGCLASPEAVYR